MFLRLIIALSLFNTKPALALPEATLLARYKEVVTPFVASAEYGTLTGTGGVRLAYAVFRSAQTPRGSIVILPGFSEAYSKYAELSYDLTQSGYDVLIMDHRGMGHSQHLGSTPGIVHIDTFDHYVDDAQLFVQTIVSPRQRGPLYLLAHSTGGLIGAMLLTRNEQFKAAVLSAPLFTLNTRELPEWLAYSLVTASTWLGAAEDYPPGQSAFDPVSFVPAESWTTNSIARATLQKQQWLDEPHTTHGGPSNQWLREAMRNTWKRKEFAAQISTPLLVLSADDDRFVKPEGQKIFCDHAKNCKLVKLAPGSRHELLMERDDIRDEAIRLTLGHFKP